MDYLYYLRGEQATITDAHGNVKARLPQQQLEWLISKGFMRHVKDVKGLWNFFYDLGYTVGGFTNADRLILVR